MLQMKDVRRFAVPIILGIGCIIAGAILCPPSFWDAIFPPSELPVFEVTLLNYIGVGLAIAGVVFLLTVLIKLRSRDIKGEKEEKLSKVITGLEEKGL